MRRFLLFLVLALLPLSLVMAGCPTGGGDDDDSTEGDDDDSTQGDDDDSTQGDDDDSTQGDDDDSTQGDDDDSAQGDDDDSAELSSVAGIVIDAEGSFGGLAGATVQMVDTPSSAVTTDSSGMYSVEVTPGDYAVEALFAGRYTVVVTGETAGANGKTAGLHPLMNTSTVEDLVQPLSVTQSATNGMVWLGVLDGQDNPSAGASVSIGAANDGSVGVGENGASVGSTIGNDTFILVFANVAPGATSVTVTPPSGQTCTGNTSATVFAGKATYVSYLCE